MVFTGSHAPNCEEIMVPFNQNKANAHTEPKNAVQIQIKCVCTIKSSNKLYDENTTVHH